MGHLRPVATRSRNPVTDILWLFALSPVLTKCLRLTFSLASLLAPFAIRALKTAVCPFMAAQIKAVLSSCETTIRHEAAALHSVTRQMSLDFERLDFGQVSKRDMPELLTY
jgi:hypothetical protein